MSDVVTAASKVTQPPCANAADITHQTGLIFRVAHSTASGYATAANLPVEATGRYWDILSLGANVQWGFLMKDANGNLPTPPALVYGQLSATGTGHLAAAPTLIDGVARQIYCPSGALRVVFISSTVPASAPNWFEANLSGDKTGR